MGSSPTLGTKQVMTTATTATTTLQNVSVTIRGQESQTASGSIELQSWDRKARLRRAFKVLGGCWGVGLFSVLFPLIHFVLPPSLLIAGPVAAFWVFGQESRVKGGTGTCPYCQKPLRIEGGAPKWPLRDICGACHRDVEISPS